MEDEGDRRELEDTNARLREQMASLGYAFQMGLGPEGTPYVFTDGLSSKYGHPEICMVGLPARTSAALMSDLIARIDRGERFDRPCYVAGIIPYEMPVMPIATGWDGLPYGGAVQLFVTDSDGHVPWEEECDPDLRSIQTSVFETVGEHPVRSVPLELVEKPTRPSDAEIEKRMRNGIEMLRQQVRKNGFTFQPVFPTSDSDGEPFVYTIGLSDTYGHPEIFVVGLDADDAVNLLLLAIDKVADGETFATPTFFEDEDGDVFPLRPLHEKDVDENSGLGQRVLGHGFAAVQLYYPDENGLFPWEVGCDPEYAAQADMLRTVGDPPNLPDKPRGTTLH